MPKFRETRKQLLYTHCDNLINDEEFLLLYDVNTSKNLGLDYWLYPKFDLEAVSDDDIISKFRFQKRDVYRLQHALGFPNEITCHFYNDLRVESTEVLCILLNRLACPCRYADMVPLFGRAPPQLSMIFNQTVDFINTNWGGLLQYFNQGWLSRPCLQTFSDSIYRRRAALDNVWGFLDDTIRPTCRPKVEQRILYNGHERFHPLKF